MSDPKHARWMMCLMMWFAFATRDDVTIYQALVLCPVFVLLAFAWTRNLKNDE